MLGPQAEAEAYRAHIPANSFHGLLLSPLRRFHSQVEAGTDLTATHATRGPGARVHPEKDTGKTAALERIPEAGPAWLESCSGNASALPGRAEETSRTDEVDTCGPQCVMLTVLTYCHVDRWLAVVTVVVYTPCVAGLVLYGRPALYAAHFKDIDQTCHLACT